MGRLDRVPGFLPEDDSHPPRPDLPILRHFTFTEAHAVELGVYVGLVFGWGVVLGHETAVFGAAVYLIRWFTSRTKVKDEKSKSSHGMGFHDALFAAPYFIGTTTVVALAVVFATGAV